MLKRLRSRLHGEGGFTLIELLVVILIIGILAAIAIPSFLGQKSKAADATTKSAARTAQTAIETWYTDGSSYNAATADLTNIEPTLPGTGATLRVTASGTAATSPTAPAATSTGSTSDYRVTIIGPNGRNYWVEKTGVGATPTRGCFVTSLTDAGGCKVTDTTAKTGTW